jgi:N-methylhydantoinase A
MPGVLAALGAVRSDLTATRVRSVLLPLVAESEATLEAALAEAGEGALARLDAADATLSHALDLRYAGQSYELTIDLERPDGLETELPRARAAFDALHEARYAHHDPDAPVEIVNVRVTARVAGADIDPLPQFGADAAETTTGEVWFGGERLEARFVDRAGLAPGDRIEAPAIVTQLDSTTLVPPGWSATVDERGNLLLERS